ncbi:zinc-binding dehydrogenase [Amycolatopsis sp. FDAARGOS 1241]|uniref:zinc-binding dehydrogenase n=1 Tax=Amycolatopsis sp. FDAARGOS 1241 TaxID=2778070 RepID=UPI0019515621|nr:zinc-binding dehydrogenase [Amycolatopsis sp. FDAARGOS 1241]QRP47035.1 zinc-binding dehydrogenase [Amycolatopsis sp. FDAARGOS 1241]
MKAVVIREFGPADGLVVVDVEEPEPKAGEVLVDVEAIGVGGVDAVIRRGTLGGYGFEPGHLPGSEVAGTVAGTGDGVDPAWRGRRVWAFTGVGGGYAERAVAGVGDVVPLPDGLAAEDAVTLGSSGPVAHFALEHAHFKAGESVLVRGAAGSIGIAAVQLAKQHHAETVAVTTSSARRGERLRELGADRVLDRQGRGDDTFDVVLDLVAGADLGRFLRKLTPNGRYVVLGVVGGMPPAEFGAELLRNFRQSLSFATFSADTVPTRELRDVAAEHFRAATRNRLRTAVHEVLKLGQAAEAHRKMDDGEVFGRIVLKP